MPFPKVSMTQIADKEVSVVTADPAKLNHFTEHLVAAGHACDLQSEPFSIAYKGNLYEASQWLKVHGDIHDVSEIVRECWP